MMAAAARVTIVVCTGTPSGLGWGDTALCRRTWFILEI